MSGNRTGGIKAAITNKTKYGEDFYVNLGRKGGKKGTTGGFAYGDNGKKFGRLGGKISHRPRVIDINKPLKASEMNELIPLAIQALVVLRINGVITSADESKLRVNVWEMASRDEWVDMFRNLGVGPSVEMAWMAVLTKELHTFRQSVIDGTVTQEAKIRFKDIKNIIKAYEVATNKKVK